MNEMNKEIKNQIEITQRRLEDVNERLHHPKKGKLGLLDRLSLNSATKDYQKNLQNYSDLEKCLFGQAYELPSEALERLNQMSQLIPAEERKKFESFVNDALRNANQGQKEHVEQKLKEIDRLFQVLRVRDKKFIVHDASDHKSRGIITFETAMEKVGKNQLRDLTPSYFQAQNHQKSDQSLLQSDDLHFLNDLEQAIKANELEVDEKTKVMIQNFSQIKEAFQTKSRSGEIVLSAQSTISSLEHISEVDFTKVTTFLKHLQSENKKQQEKAERYLSKFDFQHAKKLMAMNKENKKREEQRQHSFQMYSSLAYELEKAMQETPEDYHKIKEIQSRMRSVAANSGLSSATLDEAKGKGSTKYTEEIHAKKMMVQDHLNTLEQNLKWKIEARKSLREEAIRQLKFSKDYGGYENRNGDFYATMSKEEMIESKMKELENMSFMTPEERGLADAKRRGRLPEDATLDSLSPSQRNDFQIGYSDQALGLSKYKKSVIQNQGNPIFREYLQYRASFMDKQQCLSFSDFAKEKYQIENMTTEMVDENLQEELRGMSR